MKKIIKIILISIISLVGLVILIPFLFGISNVVHDFCKPETMVNDSYYIGYVDVPKQTMLYVKVCSDGTSGKECSNDIGVGEQTVIGYWSNEAYIFIKVAPDYDGKRSYHEYDTVNYIIPLSNPINKWADENYLGPINDDELDNYILVNEIFDFNNGFVQVRGI